MTHAQQIISEVLGNAPILTQAIDLVKSNPIVIEHLTKCTVGDVDPKLCISAAQDMRPRNITSITVTLMFLNELINAQKITIPKAKDVFN